MSEQEQKKSWKEFMATMLPCGHTEAQHMYDIGQSELKLEPCPFAESELSSLRSEVERMRAKVEQRDRLLDRFTANNIKLNQELEKLRTTLTVLRIDHNHETCAYDLAYWYRFHGDCCTGCGENLHLPHPLANLYPHFTGACRAALSEARKEG